MSMQQMSKSNKENIPVSLISYKTQDKEWLVMRYPCLPPLLQNTRQRMASHALQRRSLFNVKSIVIPG